jgi:thiamine-phosphate pyrophosphorylase
VVDLDVLGDAALPRARDLLAAGLPSVQLRAKGLDARTLVRRGVPFRDLAGDAGAFFVVNGEPGAVGALEADGLHLPARGLSVAEARARVPDGVAVGMSCHDEGELARAAGANWVFLSPVFATRSKPGAPALGVAELSRLASRARPPVYALGGIGAREAEECLRAGAAGVAAIRGLAGPDGEGIVRTASRLAAELDRAADPAPAPPDDRPPGPR